MILRVDNKKSSGLYTKHQKMPTTGRRGTQKFVTPEEESLPNTQVEQTKGVYKTQIYQTFMETIERV